MIDHVKTDEALSMYRTDEYSGSVNYKCLKSADIYFFTQLKVTQ